MRRYEAQAVLNAKRYDTPLSRAMNAVAALPKFRGGDFYYLTPASAETT